MIRRNRILLFVIFLVCLTPLVYGAPSSFSMLQQRAQVNGELNRKARGVVSEYRAELGKMVSGTVPFSAKQRTAAMNKFSSLRNEQATRLKQVERNYFQLKLAQYNEKENQRQRELVQVLGLSKNVTPSSNAPLNNSPRQNSPELDGKKLKKSLNFNKRSEGD